jgi:hypothetical protein
LSDKRAEEVGAELGEALQNGELTPEQAEALAYKWEQQGVDLSKLAAGLSAALVGGNVDIAANAAETAVENNALCAGACIAGAIVVIGALWTAYDVATTYQEEGGEAALKQLALDGAITVVSAGAGKIAYKIGGKVFKSAPKAWEAVKKSGLWKRGTSRIAAAKQPIVGDSKLQNLMDNIYKGTKNPNRVGDGTLADAVRYENATGGTVGGKTHTIKAQETIRGLENWLKRNPHGLQVDRQEAITQIENLKNALGR